MTDGIWGLVVVGAILVFGLGGYLLGRRNGARKGEIDRLKKDLHEANQRAEQLAAGVNSHFEQSAVLFSQLSTDYRRFLDHFQSSATELGLSQARAEELLDQVARPLLPHAEAERPRALDEADSRVEPEAPRDHQVDKMAVEENLEDEASRPPDAQPERTAASADVRPAGTAADDSSAKAGAAATSDSAPQSGKPST